MRHSTFTIFTLTTRAVTILPSVTTKTVDVDVDGITCSYQDSNNNTNDDDTQLCCANLGVYYDEVSR